MTKKEEKITRPLTEKERQKRQEDRFNKIAIVVVALIALAVVVIMGVFIYRNVDHYAGKPYEKDNLYGCWYSTDGKECWRFSKDDEGYDYVYFFSREKEEEPYIAVAYTAFTVEEKAGKVNVFYKQGVPTAFGCVLKKDDLKLFNEDSTIRFERGIEIAEKNMLILGVKGSPYEKEALLGSWISESGNHRWDFEKDLLSIYKKGEDGVFALTEKVPYTPGTEDGTLIVEHTGGGSMRYACTIRDGKLILVANKARTIFTRG